MKPEIHAWMQLLGFERNDPDCGAARFLDEVGFLPDSVCALLFHSDFVHLHRGMEEEYPLFPDNCAYYGIPRNTERERQAWSNHDLRRLIGELKARGVDFYAGLMGTYLSDLHHREWLSEHPELRCAKRDTDGNLMCLKRFADGSYYEDFFIPRLVETLVDYGCAGVHLSDSFCPTSRLYVSDYSTDFIGQFLDHTGCVLPPELTATLGDDSFPCRRARAEYIFGHLRKEWIRFYEWRWEFFLRKLCTAVHAVGKKVMLLGMYCTDPFETEYLYGFDSRRAMAAGVDAITANILPTSVAMNAPSSPYFFHRIHLDLPLLRAQIGEGRILSMLGVQDAAEEWSVLTHAPVQLERDLYTVTAARGNEKNGAGAAADGLFPCLCDGLRRRDWDFLKRRIDAATSMEVSYSHSPMILWSDTAAEAMLDAYLETRRPSAHKQATAIFEAGTPFGGAVRSDALSDFPGTLFVPNADLLSPDERAMLASADIPWVGTTPADVDPKALGFAPTMEAADAFSDYPLRAFACGFTPSEEVCRKAFSLCREDDGIPSEGDRPEADCNPLETVIPFRKLTRGFVEACALLLRDAMYTRFPISANCPMLALHLTDGRDRLYLYNRDEHHYGHAVVSAQDRALHATVAGTYPVLPVRYLEETNTAFGFDYNAPTSARRFQTKLAPGGVTVVEIEQR